MKNRIGHVSNSSSSSFVIIGTDNNEIIEKVRKAIKIPSDDIWEFIDENSSSYYGAVCFDGVEIFMDCEGDIYNVGITLEEDVANDITFGDLKKASSGAIGKLIGEKISISDLKVICGISYSG